MRTQLTSGELNRFSPREPGLHAHCVRVLTLASEIGKSLNVPFRSAVILEQAALLHHAPELQSENSVFNRLAADVLNDRAPWTPIEIPEALRRVLLTFHGFPALQGKAAPDLLP